MIPGNIRKCFKIEMVKKCTTFREAFILKAYLLLFISLFTLCGCSATKNEVAETKQNVISVKNSTFKEVDKQTGQEISKHLVELSTSIPNVNDATAVVLGPYAIVGIDVNKESRPIRSWIH